MGRFSPLPFAIPARASGVAYLAELDMGDTVHQEILWKSVEEISVVLVLCLVCSALIWLGDNETLVGGFHMNQVRDSVVFLVALEVLPNGAFNFTWADHDEHKEQKRYQKISDDDDNHEYDEEDDEDHFQTVLLAILPLKRGFMTTASSRSRSDICTQPNPAQTALTAPHRI